MAMLLTTRRKTIFIGCFSFIVPLIVNFSVSLLMKRFMDMDLRLRQSLPAIALVLSLTAFHDTSCVLDDLNLLNSEIGRLSLSISFVSGIFSWAIVFIIFSIKEILTLDLHTVIFSWMSKALLFCFILFLVRPLYLWMIRNTPEGDNLKEGYVILIFLLVLISAFYTESIGEKAVSGAVLMGLAVPVGPPIASAIVEKLEYFVTLVLLPSFFIGACYQIDVFNINLKNFAIVELLVFLGFFMRLIAVLLPCLYCEMPFQEALSISLILNCDGIFALLILARLLNVKWIDKESYTIIILTRAWIQMAASPLVKRLYNPSRRYAGYKRQTIQNVVNSRELRILACVFDKDSVPGILNFLEAINPAQNYTVCIYVLHLVELVGRAASILVTHKHHKNRHSGRANNASERIIKAFHHFEQHNQGFLVGQAFTTISPFSGMHNDVCNLIMDKRTALVIIPFHESVEHPIRLFIQNVWQKAPCSVGILFDHLNGSRSILDVCIRYENVAMIFIGGPDDREALTLSMKMAENLNVNLTVFRFTFSGSNGFHKNTKKDDDAIRDFWSKLMDTENIAYKEEEVTDGADTACKLKAIENTCDFIMVGRRHNNSSPILSGLDEWSVYKELGVIGDLLATSNSLGKFSVLVVQQ
ncbi:cation/H(+) antiporter 15-like [Papaver somniferum]|nr:cation/H(+) antiporter 15-like [Papaver somniferum]